VTRTTTGQAEPAHEPWSGRLISIYTAETAGVEMHFSSVATFLEGVGIEGDRYALRRGHYSHLWHPDRQVTAIAQEVIDDVAYAIGRSIDPAELRRNLITRDVPLNDLVGEFFTVGEVVLYGGRLNVPCRYLERLIDKPVFEPLLGRSGLNCQILRGGVARPGDAVLPVPGHTRSELEAKVAS
jgi:MOSC domain-containing protein YiiM